LFWAHSSRLQPQRLVALTPYGIGLAHKRTCRSPARRPCFQVPSAHARSPEPVSRRFHRAKT
ncbi:MAG: hypothetical protein E6501_22570, partial [Bradyrhizobium sp.]|nr:hypothetical protein [Bradyrhizobium sp.]